MDANPFFSIQYIVHTKNGDGNLCEDLVRERHAQNTTYFIVHTLAKKGFFSLWHPILYFWLFLHVIHFSFWTKTTTTLRMHSECHNRLINLVRDFWKP